MRTNRNVMGATCCPIRDISSTKVYTRRHDYFLKKIDSRPHALPYRPNASARDAWHAQDGRNGEADLKATRNLNTPIVALLALTAAIHGVFFLAPSTSVRMIANDVMQIVISTLAMVFSGYVAIHTRAQHPTLSRAWFWISMAYASTSVGNVIWAYLELVAHLDPVFSAADIGYLGFYFFYVVGILQLTRRRLARDEWLRLLTETLVVMLSGGTLWYTFILLPAVPNGEALMSETMAATIYPLLDLLAIWVTVMMLIRGAETARRRALIALLAALAVATASDTIYAILVTVTTYNGGNAVEWLLGVSALLAALAASVQWRDRTLGNIEYKPVLTRHRAATFWSRFTFAIPSALICISMFVLWAQERHYSSVQHDPELSSLQHQQIEVLTLGAALTLGMTLPRLLIGLHEQFQLTNRLNRLIDTTHLMLGSLTTPQLQQTLMHQLGGLVPFEHASIALSRDDTVDVTPYNRFHNTQNILMQRDDTAVITAAMARNCTVFLDAGHAGELAALLPATAKSTRLAALVVPLPKEDATIGAMVLMRESDAYSDDEARIATSFAQLAATAIEGKRMREQESRAAAMGERSRLARELHDSVSQALFGIFMGATTAREQSRQKLPVGDSMDYVINLTEGALAEMRALVLELRPESLANEGLIFALEQQAAALSKRHGIQTAVHAPQGEPPLTIEGKEAIYRIGMEAIQNAIKHARCKRIDLVLDTQPDAVLLEVRDDGVGFDTSTRRIGHFGLSTMRERAEVHGGDVTIDSAPGAGTRVQASIPLRIKIDQASAAGSGSRV
jgi:signal transduction histidine kinase